MRRNFFLLVFLVSLQFFTIGGIFYDRDQGDQDFITVSEDLTPTWVRMWKSRQDLPQGAAKGEGKRNRPQFLSLLGGARGFGKRPEGARGFGKRSQGVPGFRKWSEGARGFGKRSEGAPGFGEWSEGAPGFGERAGGASGFGEGAVGATGFEKRAGSERRMPFHRQFSGLEGGRGFG